MKRKSAFSRALQEAQNSTTVEQKNGETVKPLRGDSETVKDGLTKTSFYIRRDQVEKLDDLAHEFKKRTGKRIDRQDIVRALIDEINLDNLLNLI